MMTKVIKTLLVISVCSSGAWPNTSGDESAALEACAEFGKICDPKKTQMCCGNYGICRSMTLDESMGKIFKCLAPARLGEFCKNDIDCLRLDNAICNKDLHQCECLPNFGLLIKNGRCQSLIGGDCLTHGHCKVVNSVCVDKKCQCKEKFVRTSSKRCIVTPIGQKCKKDLDCGDVLHNGCSVFNFCVCKDNHELRGNSTCVPMLDELCWSDEQCAPENSVCFKNKCHCKLGYSAVSNTQCLKTKLGRSCKNHGDCRDIPNAQCSIFGACICRDSYISVGTDSCRTRPNSTDAFL